MTDKPAAGTILRDARAARGLHLHEVARPLRVSVTYVSDVERGNRPAGPLLEGDRRPILVSLLGEAAVASAEGARVSDVREGVVSNTLRRLAAEVFGPDRTARGLAAEIFDVVAPDDVPEDGRDNVLYDCRTCGACCRGFVVTVDDDDPVPAELVKDHMLLGRMMRERGAGPNPKNAGCGTCIAFRGTVGERASCTIYDNRPRVCREFPNGSQNCLACRLEAGLSICEVRTDGTTVWVNDSHGGSIGRFSPLGVDVHRPTLEQSRGGSECLLCTHPPTPPDWNTFVTGMRHHHQIDIPDRYRPAWAAGATP